MISFCKYIVFLSLLRYNSREMDTIFSQNIKHCSLVDKADAFMSANTDSNTLVRSMRLRKRENVKNNDKKEKRKKNGEKGGKRKRERKGRKQRKEKLWYT